MAGNNRGALVQGGAVYRQAPAPAAANPINREEVDSRSIYVGNVDYACTPEEVLQHFTVCGVVNRVTIATNALGQPKGYAYVEFREPESVATSIHLNGSELHGRELKVAPKRTNVPGLRQYRPRRHVGDPSRRYGRFPRNRPPMRYRPY